ncbi:xanthine dehydrogenase family protein molybdopterin-binding subunit [Taklimakanibacter deserti]|uniref:xanthine dehydrogenase family protein molybdopterin-binding subunit n=1 Tax=Taklimakanibacter deserti TaxID=2267839 RepID=UPI000E65BD6F
MKADVGAPTRRSVSRPAKTGRTEDLRFITGAGRYIADIHLEGEVHAAFARSPYASAGLKSVDVSEALKVKGVLAAFTGTDLVAAGLSPLPCVRPIESVDGKPFHTPVRHALAVDAVRFVGDPIAIVIAETDEAAAQAAGLVFADCEERAPVLDVKQSEERAFLWEKGDAKATETAFTGAARIVDIEVVNGRVLISPLEPRGALADYDAASGTYTLYTPSQGVHLIRRLVVPTLGVSLEKLRVITNDVGGSFGSKLVNSPEQTALLFAAKELGRPVRWISSRLDCHLADIAGRDHVSRGSLALDKQGRILGLRIKTFANLGAYASALSPSTHTGGFAATSCGPYRIPALHLLSRGVYTNTAPTDAYRGSGKPESIYLLERLMDRAGRETGLGPIEIRRLNLITPPEMPYKAANGVIYDSGDFPEVLASALELADWAGFDRRRKASAKKGLRRGRGIGLYIHTTGVTSQEISRVRLDPAGLVIVETGLQSSGQSHETTFAQLMSQKLGLPFDRVKIVQGDSALADSGGPTAGSSSLQVGGVTMIRAMDRLLEQAKQHAADELEVNALDLDYGQGEFRVTGTDRVIGLFDLASTLAAQSKAPCCGEAALDGNILTIPNGAYICEVEIDPDTGGVTIARFSGVDDVGKRLNPEVVAGQIHGGIAQGVGQALTERVLYDPATGQLLTGSLMDYGLPRADDMPMFTLGEADLPTDNNILGMKGAGEIGCIGAPAAIMNAIADAIGHDRIDMPAMPEAVWRALNETRKA